MAHSPLLKVMRAAAEKAGRAIARDFGEIENIQGNKEKLERFVAHTKSNAEELVLAELENARPGFGYVSSLNKKDTSTKERWLINILEGEDNFLRAIPQWCISLALEDENGVMAGVVYDVIRNETYYAQKGYGAFVNSRRLKVLDRRDMGDAIVFSSFDAKTCGAPTTRLAQGKALYNNCVHAVRNMGSLALDICYVSANKGDVCFSNVTTSYAVAAAGIIAKEAGLFVSTLKGDKDFVYGGTLVVASPSLHMTAVKLLNV